MTPMTEGLYLHFSDPGMEPLCLNDTQALNWRAGRVWPVMESAPALLWLHNSPRGLWLTRSTNAPTVHLNGRRIQRMAWLRGGDVLHVGQTELRLVGRTPTIPSTTDGMRLSTHQQQTDPRVLLRCVGGHLHGRSFTLERPRLIGRSQEADIHIDDPAFAEQHARLEWRHGQVLIRDLGSSEGSLLNGHPVRDAVLEPFDQIVFATHERFILEAPCAPRPAPPPNRTTIKSASTHPPPLRWSRVLWLLLTATLLAGGLLLLLLRSGKQ